DRDVELACFLAKGTAARVLVERGVDGDDAARGIVARPRAGTPASFAAQAARDRRSRLTKAQQRDHARRQRHATSLDGLGRLRTPAPRRLRRCVPPGYRAGWQCAAWVVPRRAPGAGRE